MAYTTINDSSAYFQSLLYTGNSSSRSVTFDGNSNLQPDWVWVKGRSNSGDHFLFDTNRGVYKNIHSNDQAAQVNNNNSLTAFNSNGFSMGNVGGMNYNSNTYIGWGWKANGGTTATNSSGDITSTVQANTTAGFSIVTYIGNGTSNQTVGHGLGATPDCLMWKNYDASTSGWNWKVWHKDLSGTNILVLNNSDASASSNGDVDALPTSTLFTVGNNGSTNGQSGQNQTMICYAFTSIKGFSKFGKYTGNGSSTNGPFIYTGFKVKYLLIKRTNADQSWHISDTNMDPINPNTQRLLADSTGAEETRSTTDSIDFLSNGFKVYSDQNIINGNGDTYVYMAFAKNPLVGTNGVPTTAK